MKGISKGKIKRPVFIIAFGPDGVGKSTFGAEAPNPVFLGPEDGTANLDVARFDGIKKYSDITTNVKRLLDEDHDFKTLVIDSLDHIEPMLWKEICEQAKVDVIEEAYGGYGKGFTRANQLWVELINDLKTLRDKKNMHIIALAHSQVKTFNDPSQPLPYDRYMLKLNEKASAIWREAVDCVLFANFEVVTKTNSKSDKKAKAYGDGARIIYTERRPSFDAKNRYGLPAQIPLSWASFHEATLSGEPDSKDAVMSELQEILTQVSEDVAKRMTLAIEKANGDVSALVKIRNHGRVLTNQ